MVRRLMVAMLTVVLATTLAGTAGAGERAPRPTPTPGAAGVGDPYFPLDGNGGYDVDDYDLAIRYDPATDVLQRHGDDPRPRRRRPCRRSTSTSSG